jgi:hypothetical protein
VVRLVRLVRVVRVVRVDRLVNERDVCCDTVNSSQHTVAETCQN